MNTETENEIEKLQSAILKLSLRIIKIEKRITALERKIDPDVTQSIEVKPKTGN